MIIVIGIIAGVGFFLARYRLRVLTTLASRWLNWRQGASKVGEQVLVVGLSEGTKIANYLSKQRTFRTAFSIVGVVDNDYPSQYGMRITGFWMLGGINDIPDLIKRHDIGVVLSTLPQHNPDNERILELCQLSHSRLIFLDDLLSLVDRQETQPLGEIDSQVLLDGRLEYKAMHVFNDWTYPNFIALLRKLGVESQPSDMSFGVKCERTGLEYNGTSLNALFAQRRNLLRPSFYRMIRDILRFNRESLELLTLLEPGPSLGSYLETHRYSREFIEHYIVPMGAAIWSASHENMWRFPARYLVQFFKNHGMLSVDERPTWRVITGGSQRYAEKLIASFCHRIHLNSPVESMARFPGYVEIRAKMQGRSYRALRFDHAIIATHSDQALLMLADP